MQNATHDSMTADSIVADPKTSLAAIFGFIVSLIGCCIPMGILGVVLGVFGLIAVNRSNGRVGGKGLAIAAIIIGLLNTMVWIGGAVAAVQWGRQVKVFGDEAGSFLTLIEAQQYDEARAKLTGTVASADDAALAAYSDAVHGPLGSFVSTPDSLGGMFSGWVEFGQVMQDNQIPMSVPVPLTFTNERALIQYVWDTTNPGAGLPPMTDLMVLRSDGSTYLLSDYLNGAPAVPDVLDAGAATEAVEDAIDDAAEAGSEDGAAEPAATDDGP